MSSYGVQHKITDAQKIISFIRIQDYHNASLLLSKLLQHMFSAQPSSEELSLLQELEIILQKDDMIYLADWVEAVWIPFFQEQCIQSDTSMTSYGKYILEPTSSGWMTLKDSVCDKYLHSNTNPMEEARLWIEKIYNPDVYCYAVWGCGLGYHLKQLYEISNGSIDIHVFYEDPEQYSILKNYCLLQDIPKEHIHFTVDPEAVAFTEFISNKKCEIVMHFPSILCIKNLSVKNALHVFFAKWNSMKQEKKNLAINFRSNIEICHQNADELKDFFYLKEAIIVGGGPSLDHGLDYLRNMQGKKLILAVTTVLDKLLQEQIYPDFAFVLEPQSRTLGHIKALKDVSVPLILASTAYWQFTRNYPGPKYIVYQNQYLPAENRAIREGHILCETGGTVTSLALDLAIKFGCRSIELLGVDLAFPANKSHATGTMDFRNVDTNGMITCEDVMGHPVKTNTQFLGYREWMERKIQKHPEVQFINLSDCGAKIAGTTHKCFTSTNP